LKTALIACDVHRPAAYDQLSQIGKKLNIPVYGDPSEKKAIKILRTGLKEFKDEDIIIIDTSGRHSLEAALIDEIKQLSKEAQADERFLVLDATIGQQAGPQAKAFHDAVDVTGVILTKMDGSAKGGGALSAVAETGAPIVCIGVGEHLEDIEKFDPPRFVSRMLGMGDIQSLLEKASEVMTEEKAEDMARKLTSGRFTLKDMYEQMEMLEGVGPMNKIMQMIPGFSGKVSEKDMEVSQERLKKFRIIMDSMTEAELEDPKMIKSSRVLRIAKGSGTSPKDVRGLLKQYNMSKKAIKGFMGNRKMRRQLMKQMKMDEKSLG
ncbi:MAG: signal recognition particle protein Srp19, partial [Thermoplasmata archaeon]|nr:signal recognition particle protein Srp19 [Thermoplasmata archaeon]